eukprot:COSAG02_NODE_29863_length_561_cov_1.160173_1_plen_25_part_01
MYVNECMHCKGTYSEKVAMCIGSAR